MRLLTRSDFDGLICAVLLKKLGVMDEWKFVHPKDVQDGLVEVNSNDILANVPYAKGCGLWFDHHMSERERLGMEIEFEGASNSAADSAARVIWEYYGGHKAFPESFDEMLEYVDRCDSGKLTLEEIENPTGWVLLSFIMDPRTGLGRYRDYRISNYQLMMDLVDMCADTPVEQILASQDVKQRVDRYFDQDRLFREMLSNCSVVKDNLVILDFRDQEEIYTGNRFTIYAMYPQCNISMHVIWGKQKQNVVFTLGHSILNRTSNTNVGSLMLEYGGGGHARVGTCQVATEVAEKVKKELIEKVTADG
jgi:nanoRNase/pAp phosphatase (c-di-AMP/oligoRNAs hydrolase)